MIARLTQLLGGFSFGPLLPWGLAALVAAFAYLLIANVGARANTAACEAKYSRHLAADEQAARTALELQRAAEDRNRAERAALDARMEQERREMESRLDHLRADLRSGARRMRPELCTTGPAVPASGAAAGGSPTAQPPPDGASRLERAVRAAAECDADYARLYAIAQGDRRTVGVAP